jgi:multiple sugar transport system ATP-binding protein
MVLVGPSGCGKSTLLRMLAGLEEISGGSISIADRVVNDLPPKDRDIAMVFQSYALYPHMTVRENIEFGLKIRKLPKAEIDRLVAEAAQILDIGHLLDRKPKQLSGGQRQRVAVGRAIVRKPSVFLFDEPLSNLDAKLRVEVRAEIKKLQARLQTTTVYVTHDQVEAMTMGHRIAILNAGKLQQVGTPLEVYEKPANLFTAGFIGTPPMNSSRPPSVRAGRWHGRAGSSPRCRQRRGAAPVRAPRWSWGFARRTWSRPGGSRGERPTASRSRWRSSRCWGTRWSSTGGPVRTAWSSSRIRTAPRRSGA